MATQEYEEYLQEQARAAGFRLEMVRGIPTWETMPRILHQRAVDRIRASIRPETNGDKLCDCVHYADIEVKFPDGSYKQPDVAVFCKEPVEIRKAVTEMPDAVIEILSENYEAKDLLVGVPFYRQVGIADVIVFDPEEGRVWHYRHGAPEETHVSPVTLTLLCGCVCTV